MAQRGFPCSWPQATSALQPDDRRVGCQRTASSYAREIPKRDSDETAPKQHNGRSCGDDEFVAFDNHSHP